MKKFILILFSFFIFNCVIDGKGTLKIINKTGAKVGKVVIENPLTSSILEYEKIENSEFIFADKLNYNQYNISIEFEKYVGKYAVNITRKNQTLEYKLESDYKLYKLMEHQMKIHT